jgi:hypothetical protein
MRLKALAESAKPVVHLKNCFELAETEKRCRFCAFIAQNLAKDHQYNIRRRLVAADLMPDMNIPLAMQLEHDMFRVYLGYSDLAFQFRIELTNGKLGL